jgi:hypothetical protein
MNAGGETGNVAISGRTVIGRQTMPPLRRVVSIAFAGMKVRLTRTAITLGGVCLALAYVVSIRLTDQATGNVAILAQAPKTYDERGNFHGLEGIYHPALEVSETQVKRYQAQLLERAQASLAGRHSSAEPDAQLAVRKARVLADGLQAALERNGLAANLSEPELLVQQRAASLWIMAIVIVVAAAGILNSMLMSVSERFREIGTMKCLGARDELVLLLFLLESVVLGFIGSVVGILGGALLSLLNLWWAYGWAAWLCFPWEGIGTESAKFFVGGIVLTVVGSLGPAYQAARMAPVAAMRVDQ